jgi:hypothetical protein
MADCVVTPVLNAGSIDVWRSYVMEPVPPVDFVQ